MNKHPKILVIGDHIIDEYVYGECCRISPEAPVPVVAEKKRVTKPGGAGNVVENLKALGAEVFYWSGSLENASRKIRILAGHQQVCRLDNDNLIPIKPPSNLDLMVDEVDAVVIADYNKGVVTKKLIHDLDVALAKYPTPLFVDPYVGKFDYGNHVTLIKPNLREMESVVGFSIPDEDDEVFNAAIDIYFKKSKAEHIVLTLGANGMILCYANSIKEPYYVKTEAQQVFDVTGAGDTAIAVMAYIWASADKGKFSKRAVVDWANKAAGIVCGKLGTATVTYEELFGKEETGGPNQIKSKTNCF
jgi:rfaE bifunctional protein kinase chain/domain